MPAQMSQPKIVPPQSVWSPWKNQVSNAPQCCIWPRNETTSWNNVCQPCHQSATSLLKVEPILRIVLEGWIHLRRERTFAVSPADFEWAPGKLQKYLRPPAWPPNHQRRLPPIAVEVEINQQAHSQLSGGFWPIDTLSREWWLMSAKQCLNSI